MSFQHTTYNQQFLRHIAQTDTAANNAATYDVRILPAEVEPGASYWRIIGVHHLKPSENRGRHHAFIDVLDEDGHRVTDPNLYVYWSWKGRTPDQKAPPKPLDKPATEPAGNLPIQRGMELELWIQGDGSPSERVQNLHARHADEPAANGELWNSLGHHSFYVVFQRTRRVDATPIHGQNGTAQSRPDAEAGGTPNGSEASEQETLHTHPSGSMPHGFPEYIFGLHEHAGGGEQLMLDAARRGWVLELAEVGLDGGSDNADFRELAAQGLGVMVRLNHGYEPAGTIPKPQHYAAFAQACATFVKRSRGCHIWVLGNEPNHAAERPGGEFIYPQQYAAAYTRCRRAIRKLPGHERDRVLVAGPAPWNAETKYDGNPKGDWVQYFADTIAAIAPGECDGFAIHTYTRRHDPSKIRADIRHSSPGYEHLRDEFRTYRDFMEAIPGYCRHLPVFITETDPTDPEHGWGEGHNNGWVQEAYREIADWNRDPSHQPIQALLLYRWPHPHHHGQRQWSIADRPGVVDDFRAALRAEPGDEYRIRMAASPSIPLLDTGQTSGAIPAIFTNQHIINAFFYAAAELGMNGDALMQKAGLDVQQLAVNPQIRKRRYMGAPIAELPHLSDAERALIKATLLGELRPLARWRSRIVAPAGLNLRDRPGTDTTVLTTLPNETPVDVLDEQGEWLFVITPTNRAGYVFAQYVPRAMPDTDGTDATQPDGTQPDTLQPEGEAQPMSGFLAADPALRTLPLAAADADVIPVDASAGPGAQRLADIWNQYGNLLREVARRLAIDPAVAVAVLAVESGGAGFADGRLLIRFENHLFFDEWGRHHQEIFARHFTFAEHEAWRGHAWRASVDHPFQEFHGNQALEWQVFNFAAKLDDTAAKRSTNMGAPQILGRNHTRIGYSTVQAMFDAFGADVRHQILGLFDFIRTDANLLRALRERAYVAFAEGYNGSGQAQFYANLIAQHVEALAKLRTTAAETTFAIGGTRAALDADLDATVAFLPKPQLPDAFVNIPAGETEATQPPEGESETTRPNEAVDAELVRIWRTHVQTGLENNNVMFNRILRAFMMPYYLTVVLYTALFVVGVGLFVAAAWTGVRSDSDVVPLFFGGLGVVAFLTFFISRPLRALESNLQFVTWLGILYNTYWTRLLYMQDGTTAQADLEDATTDAVRELERLIDKNSETSRANRPFVGTQQE